MKWQDGRRSENVEDRRASGGRAMPMKAGMGGIGIWLGLVTGLACAGVLLMWRFWRFGLNQVGPPDDAAQGPG